MCIGCEKNELRVRYVIYYQFGYRHWGFVESQADFDKEIETIKAELEALKSSLPMSVKFDGGDVNPVFEDMIKVLKEGDYDAVIVYSISGSQGHLFPEKGIPTFLFVKLHMGPSHVYQETLHGPFRLSMLRKAGLSHLFSLVIDDYNQLAVGLKGLYALKNLRNMRVLTMENYERWSHAKERFGFQVESITLEELVSKIEKVSDAEANSLATEFLEKALKVIEPTQRDAVVGAKIYLALKRLLMEKNCDAVTISCLGAGIIDALKATPCWAFSKLCDEGVTAACEADFSGLLTQRVMSSVAGKPSFITDPVIHPGTNTLLLAHCTSPRKMKGYESAGEPYVVRTHRGTNLGVTPQVKFSVGKTVTVAGFAHDFKSIIITKGTITRNTELPVCHCQMEVKVEDAERILDNYLGFHWEVVYGDYVAELKEFCRQAKVEPVLA